MIHRIYTFIKRFVYYGYHGAKYTRDYDANSVDALIYCHMKRVSDFMHSPNKTHLLWNDSPDTKGMKRLREFTELAKRRTENDFNDYYYYLKFTEEHPDYEPLDFNGNKYRKQMRLAFKKDRIIADGLEKRYWYMLQKYLPGFWD